MYTPQKIAVYLRHSVPCWNFREPQIHRLHQLLPDTKLAVCESRERFLEELADADTCMIWTFKQEWFQSAPKLRLLSTPAAGKDYFQVVFPENVALMNGQFHGAIIAETVAGFLLGIMRGILPSATNYPDNPWPRVEVGSNIRMLHGSHLAILGFGHIGQEIGKLLKAFGVRITGVKRDPNIPKPDWFTEGDRIVAASECEAVLPTVDAVICALPATPETTAFLNAKRISLLPHHAVIVNIGRGNAIEESALCDALRERRIFGAGIDVFTQEPLPAGHPFLTCPNLWRLPHDSAVSDDYLTRYVEDFVRQLALPLVHPTFIPSAPVATI